MTDDADPAATTLMAEVDDGASTDVSTPMTVNKEKKRRKSSKKNKDDKKKSLSSSINKNKESGDKDKTKRKSMTSKDADQKPGKNDLKSKTKDKRRKSKVTKDKSTKNKKSERQEEEEDATFNLSSLQRQKDNYRHRSGDNSEQVLQSPPRTSVNSSSGRDSSRRNRRSSSRSQTSTTRTTTTATPIVTTASNIEMEGDDDDIDSQQQHFREEPEHDEESPPHAEDSGNSTETTTTSASVDNNNNEDSLLQAQPIDEEAQRQQVLQETIQATAEEYDPEQDDFIVIESHDEDDFSNRHGPQEDKGGPPSWRTMFFALLCCKSAQYTASFLAAVMCGCCLLMVVIVVVVPFVVISQRNDATAGEAPVPDEENIFRGGVKPTPSPTISNAPSMAPSLAPTLEPRCAVEVLINDTATWLTGQEFADLVDDVTYNEVGPESTLDCQESGVCSPSTNGVLQMVDCDNIECTGAFSTCAGLRVDGTSHLECGIDGIYSCGGMEVTNLVGPNASVFCPSLACMDIVISDVNKTRTSVEHLDDDDDEGPTVSCVGDNACGRANIDLGGPDFGTVICTGDSKGWACGQGMSVNAKCLVCEEQLMRRQVGCFGVNFQGVALPQVLSSRGGYCGNCSHVPEANGLPEVCGLV